MKRDKFTIPICILTAIVVFCTIHAPLSLAQVRTCDLAKATSVLVLQKHLVISGFLTGEVQVFDTHTQQLSTVYPARSFSSTRAGKLVASPAGDRFVAFTGDTRYQSPRPGYLVELFGAQLFKVTPDGKVHVRPLRTWVGKNSYEMADYGALAFVKSWRTPWLLAITAQKLGHVDLTDARVIFFNAQTGQRYWTFVDPNSTYPIARVDFSKDGRFAVIPAHSPGGSRIGVRVLDLVAKKEVKFLEAKDADYQVIDGEYLQFKDGKAPKGRITFW